MQYAPTMAAVALFARWFSILKILAIGGIGVQTMVEDLAAKGVLFVALIIRHGMVAICYITLMNKKRAWDYAFGLIKVDGLKPSDDFIEMAEKEIRGELTLADIEKSLNTKYKMK